MDLSICIVSMNHKQVLDDCLKSIFENSPLNYSYEIIIVDNCSVDGSREMLEKYSVEHSNTKVFFNSTIKSFSANNNIAMSKSGGRYFLILNPDTIIYSGTLDYMLDYMKVHNAVGATTCKLIYADGSLQENCRRFLKIKYQIASRLNTWGFRIFEKWNDEYIMSKEGDTEPKEVDWILGACMFIRKEVIDQVGKFDERFLLYFEETDLCYRIRQTDWKIMYVPEVSIVHLYARMGAKKFFSKYSFFQFYSLFIFYAKHYWKILK